MLLAAATTSTSPAAFLHRPMIPTAPAPSSLALLQRRQPPRLIRPSTAVVHSSSSRWSSSSSRRRRSMVPLAASSSNDDPNTSAAAPSSVWTRAAGRPFKGMLTLMALYSSILGPCLDGYHGKYGVLVYDQLPITISVAGQQLLGTSVWVPPMFAVAGVIMGGLYILLDEILQTSEAQRRPSAPKVLLGISLFSFQYFVSGIGAGRYLWDYGPLNGVLFALAAACFFLFDQTKTGLIVGLLTMLSGPALEMALIKFTDLYHYSMPDSVGLLLVPSFIFPVYLAGAPAVGNLARLTYQWLLERAEEEGEGPEV